MKKLFILLIAFSLNSGLYAQTFRNFIGKENSQEYAYSVSEAADSSYLVAAKYTNDFWGTAFPVLAGVGKNGNVSWIKEFKITNLPSVYSTWAEAVKTRSGKPDGSIVLIDVWKSFYLVRLQQNGSIMWTKKFTQANYFINSAIRVKPIYDINASLTGYYVLGNHYNSDGSFLIKTDVAGSTVWQKKFKHAVSTGTYWLEDIKTTSDGGCVITGTQGGANVSSLPVVFKVGVSGNMNWARSYQFNAEKNCSAESIAISNDGYVITGSQADYNNLTFKIKTDGSVTWSNFYKTTDVTVKYTAGLAIVTDAVGNLIVTGSTDNAGSNKPGIIAKLTSAGSVIFAKSLSAELSYHNATLNSMVVTSTGNYCVAGTSAPHGATADIYLLNMTSTGGINASCRPKSFVLSASASPLKTSVSAAPFTLTEVLTNATVSCSAVNINTQNDLCGNTVNLIPQKEISETLQVSNDIAGQRLLVEFKANQKEENGSYKAVLINSYGQAIHTVSITSGKSSFIAMNNMHTGIYSVAIMINGKIVIQEKAIWVK